MSHFVIGSDNIDKNERTWLNAIKNRLQQAGHQVTDVGIGPGVVQKYGGRSASKGKIGLILAGGSDLGMYEDFYQGLKRGYYHYDKMGVLFNSWSGSKKGTTTCYGVKNYKLGRAHDDNYSSAATIARIKGQTADEYFSKHSDKIFYACTEKSGVEGCNELADIAASQGYGSSTGSSTNGTMTVDGQFSNPMLAGEKTFQEIISEICDGIDILFLCKKNRVVVTDFEQIYADALYLREHNDMNTKDEDIKLWQLEDGSYELNVDQFGFYNAVIVYYSGGKIYEQFDDLVDVYGVQVKVYNDKTLTKSQAQAKAKAYLAAHVRDFNMGINASVLENGIDIGDIVTLKNPMSYHKYKKIPEYLFVEGVSISWSGDYIYTDLELKYGPESPERPEVPTTGVGSVRGSSSGNTDESGLIQIGNDLASKYKFSRKVASSYCAMRAAGTGDCFAWSGALWQELKNAGYTPRVVQYPTAYSPHHRSVQYKDASGQWVDYPYSSTNIPWGAKATSGSKSGIVVVNEHGFGNAANIVC